MEYAVSKKGGQVLGRVHAESEEQAREYAHALLEIPKAIELELVLESTDD